MNDWDIDVKLVDFIKIECATAHCDVDMAQKQVTMEILTEEGHRVNFTNEQDMLSSLVHELLHLHFIFSFNEQRSSREAISQAEYQSFEAGINLATGGLVGLYRELCKLENENGQLIADKLELQSQKLVAPIEG